MNPEKICEEILTDTVFKMIVEMIKQDCPDTSPIIGTGWTLGDWKKDLKFTEQEINLIKTGKVR